MLVRLPGDDGVSVFLERRDDGIDAAQDGRVREYLGGSAYSVGWKWRIRTHGSVAVEEAEGEAA